MSNVNESAAFNQSLSAMEETAKTNALIAYFMMVVGIFTGIFWVIGAVWAMVKKSDASGTQFEDHYSNIISTFWWGLGLSIIGMITAYFIIGYFILFGVWIWAIVRVVKGLARLTSNKSYR